MLCRKIKVEDTVSVLVTLGNHSEWENSKTTSRKDDLIAWLRDAHAMEAATTDNLERFDRAGR